MKIGYIDDKSKIYNENLTLTCRKNYGILVKIFTKCLLYEFGIIDAHHNIKNDVKRKIFMIFRNL